MNVSFEHVVDFKLVTDLVSIALPGEPFILRQDHILKKFINSFCEVEHDFLLNVLALCNTNKDLDELEAHQVVRVHPIDCFGALPGRGEIDIDILRSKHALAPPIRQLHFIAERCEVHEAELGEGRPTGKLDEYVFDLLGVLADDFVQLQDFLGLWFLAEKLHSHVLQVVLNAILGCVFIICDPVCENTGLL